MHLRSSDNMDKILEGAYRYDNSCTNPPAAVLELRTDVYLQLHSDTHAIFGQRRGSSWIADRGMKCTPLRTSLQPQYSSSSLGVPLAAAHILSGPNRLVRQLLVDAQQSEPGRADALTLGLLMFQGPGHGYKGRFSTFRHWPSGSDLQGGSVLAQLIPGGTGCAPRTWKFARRWFAAFQAWRRPLKIFERLHT
ncbi:hypothetical protein OH76DRAFT_1176800 [Lentinus brumalis]|uniref:Uncharacterized protein n=1 Tax=Lentinus brumalis TaxID=2498619 RepID=A0A371CU72_9APHY|nr:hypothetical protein OH76DRAFT_1176800 [Polyporus brumalis]